MVTFFISDCLHQLILLAGVTATMNYGNSLGGGGVVDGFKQR